MDSSFPLSSQIVLISLTGIVLVALPIVILYELIVRTAVLLLRKQQQRTPDDIIHSTTIVLKRPFVILFSVLALMYSMFELAIQIMGTIADHNKYKLDTHRSFFAIQRSFFSVLEVSLLCSAVLLVYSSVWTAFQSRVDLLYWSNEKRIRGWIGLKGMCVVCCLIISPLLIGFHIAESVVIAKVDRITDIVLRLRIGHAVVMFVPTLLVLPLSATCAYNALRHSDETSDRINVSEEDEQIDQKTKELKQTSFILMVLSTLLLLRLVLSLVHEVMFLLNYGGAVQTTTSVIVTDWFDSIIHAAFVAFFVLSYFKPLKPWSDDHDNGERTSLVADQQRVRE